MFAYFFTTRKKAGITRIAKIMGAKPDDYQRHEVLLTCNQTESALLF